MHSLAGILRFSLIFLFTLSSCRIEFVSDQVTSVAVTPANPTIAVSGVQQFTAQVTHKNGFTFSTTGARWSSSNPAVATISGSGRAVGVSAGTASITATVDAVSGSTTLTVTSHASAAVSVSGGNGKLEIAFASGGRYLYVANALADTISIYRLDAGGEHLLAEVSVAPGRGPVWLAVDPTGRFLYVLNRTTRDISAFALEATTGKLAAVAGAPFACGSGPWTIAVDASGEFLELTPLNSSEPARCRIDPGGALEPGS